MATAPVELKYEHSSHNEKFRLPDPRHILALFLRRITVFGCILFLVMSAVLAALVITKPVYTSTASILIEPRKVDPTGGTPVVPGLPADTYVVDTQTRLIGSPQVALATVRELHLVNNPEFRRPNKSESASLPVVAGLGSDADRPTAQERDAVASLLNHVRVQRSGLTYVIDVTATAQSADLAAAIANSIARQYLLSQSTIKQSETEQAGTFVSSHADELRRAALEDDARLQAYINSHNLMSAQGATVAEQQVSSLNEQIAAARANYAQATARYDAARGQLSGGGSGNVGAVVQSETIRSMRMQESQQSAQLAELQSRYGDLHPDVIRAKRNLADVRQQISAETNRILASLRADVAAASSNLASLQGSLSGARSSLVANSSAQVGLADLQRKAEASKTVYANFLQRSKEVQAQVKAPLPDASIAAVARPPEKPLWPNYPLALLVGGIFAVILGLVGVAIAEYLDDSISTRQDVVSNLHVEYAGGLPDITKLPKAQASGSPEDHVIDHPFSLYTEAVRNIGAFLKLNRPGASKVITLASSLPREGKTTLAIGLARVLAAGQSRVLLMDGDLRRCSASQLLVPEARHGLISVLKGQIALGEALQKDPRSDLMILPALVREMSSGAFQAEAIGALMEELRKQFDIIIIDTAPVLAVADTRLLGWLSDATLLVCRWRKSSLKAAKVSIDVLDQSGARVVGTALSLVDTRKYASIGVGEAYGYHRSLSSYHS